MTASRVKNLAFSVLGATGLPVIALLTGDPVLYAASGVFVLGLLGLGGVMVVSPVASRPTPEPSSDGWGPDGLSKAVSAPRDPARLDDETARVDEPTAHALHPEPASLVCLVSAGEQGRHRAPEDGEFLHLRVGASGGSARATEGTAALEAGNDAAPSRPVALRLRAGTTTIVGPPERVRALARAVVAQLVALHSPNDVRLAVAAPATPSARPGEWEHTKWLPHVRHPTAEAAAGSWPLLLAASAGGLAELLAPELERRRRCSAQRGAGPTWGAGPALVLLVDGALTAGAAEAFADVRALGVALVVLVPDADDADGPPDVDVSVKVDDDGDLTIVERTPPAAAARTTPAEESVVADALSIAEADALARRLAPSQACSPAGKSVLHDAPRLTGLLGIADVGDLDARQLWRERAEHELLRVPVGRGVGGRPVELDLNDRERDGAGPHALVVGTSGSGKSHLLRSVVTALALTHHPRDVALALVDVSGGATFAGVEGLPHVAVSVTGVEGAPEAAVRTATWLRGELRRRQRLLEAASLPSIAAHRGARRSGPRRDLPGVPHLVVVVDEVGALLARGPDVVDLLVSVGRLGPRLGIHLVLATARPGEVRLQGLETYVGSRIVLPGPPTPRAAGAVDVDHAAPVAGSAALTVGASDPVRFRVATASAPYVAPSLAEEPPGQVAPRAFEGLRPQDGRPAPMPTLVLDPSDTSQPSTMVVAAGSLARAATAQGLAQAPRVLVAPLPTEVTLARLVGGLVRVRGRGLTVDGPVGSLRVPLGVVDLPDQQARRVFTADLGSAGGHLGVAGRAGSGKSVALATLVTSLAITHTPAQVQVYCLDLGGGTLGPLAGLPHVGAVAPRSRPDVVRATVAQVRALLDARERDAAEEGAADEAAHVVLVVDGWSVLRAEHPDLEAVITSIAVRGTVHRIHVIIASRRWTDLRAAVRNLLGTRLELKLGRPSASAFTHADAQSLPDVPGRALITGDQRVQVALPQVELRGETLTTEALGDAVRRAWSGPVTPRADPLPTS